MSRNENINAPILDVITGIQIANVNPAENPIAGINQWCCQL
jgi:hypothetical protein